MIVIGMVINGFCQSAGYPGMMAVMGNWFGKGSRGILLGLWSINANLGNIVGYSFCSLIRSHGVNWIWNFFTASFLTLLIAFSIIFILVPEPSSEYK
jgi:sugar phosphate permease